MCRFYKIVLPSLFLTFILCACGASDSEKVSTNMAYGLILVDSIQLEALSELSMIDYHEDQGLLLIENSQKAEMLVIDANGVVISRFDPYTEGPNSIGAWAYGWTFHGKDEIMAYGRTHFYRLNHAGERQERYDYPIETYGAMMLDHDPLMIESYNSDDGLKLLTMITNPSKMSQRDPNYQDSVNLLYCIDFEAGSHQPVMQKPETSLLRSLDAFAGAGWPRAAKMQGSIFAVAYEIEPKIYLYDLKDNSIIKALDIPEAYQAEFKAVDFDSRDKTEMKKTNKRLFSTGDYLILEVSTDIPEEVLKQVQQLPNWWESEEIQLAYDTHVKNYYLLFDQNQFLGEIEWNPGMRHYQVLNSNNGVLWIHRRYEDERDYHTFVKYRIGQMD